MTRKQAREMLDLEAELSTLRTVRESWIWKHAGARFVNVEDQTIGDGGAIMDGRAKLREMGALV